MNTPDNMTPVRAAVGLLGGPPTVARLRSLKSPWSVAKWIRGGVPAEHVLWLAEMTGWRYTPHQLAPALYPHPHDGLPEHLRTEAFVSQHDTAA